jgi:hypothetical protein
MINDYSEVTAGLRSKMYSMNHALEDKQYLAALGIMRDIEKDMVRLIDFVTNEIEVKRE